MDHALALAHRNRAPLECVYYSISIKDRNNTVNDNKRKNYVSPVAPALSNVRDNRKALVTREYEFNVKSWEY
jgi:hypothetical protein